MTYTKSTSYFFYSRENTDYIRIVETGPYGMVSTSDELKIIDLHTDRLKEIIGAVREAKAVMTYLSGRRITHAYFCSPVLEDK